jgi:hypothetical protein
MDLGASPTAEDQARNLVGSVLVKSGHHVAVGVHRDADVGVPQAFADDLRRNAGRQGGARIAVPKVMLVPTSAQA